MIGIYFDTIGDYLLIFIKFKYILMSEFQSTMYKVKTFNYLIDWLVNNWLVIYIKFKLIYFSLAPFLFSLSFFLK